MALRCNRAALVKLVGAFAGRASGRLVFGGLLLLWGGLGHVWGEERGGHLLILGGDGRPPGLMRLFLEFAGGPDSSRVAILTFDGGVPEGAATELVAEMKAAGTRDVFSIALDRDIALSSRTADRLDRVTGVFFLGGDQSRQTEVLLDTPVHEKVTALYRAGAVLAGMSFGWPVATGVEPSEDASRPPDGERTFATGPAGTGEGSSGLGFLNSVIVDRHFSKAGSLKGLLGAVVKNPAILGIGIDDSTAILVNPDSTFRVAGEKCVIVIDGSRSSVSRASRNDNPSAANILTHVLAAGDIYNLRIRVVTSSRAAR